MAEDKDMMSLSSILQRNPILYDLLHRGGPKRLPPAVRFRVTKFLDPQSQKAKGRRRVHPIPRLPPEVWFHVTKFLDPQSLSSFSQVNQMFHKFAMDESHFLHHLSGIEVSSSLHPAQQFRRIRGMLHPTSYFTVSKSDSRMTMLCVAHGNLILFDEVHSQLALFPRGLKVNLVPTLNGHHVRSSHKGTEWAKSYVILPEGFVTFVSELRLRCTLLIIFNTKTGDVKTYTIHEARASCIQIANQRSIVAAGENAKWLMYFADENRIQLFDWRSGIVTKTVKVRTQVRYVLDECPAIDGMSVTGFLQVRRHKDNRYAIPTWFDDPRCRRVPIHTSLIEKIQVVLRSLDKNTCVLIFKACEFPLRRMATSNRRKRWFILGRMGGMASLPELRQNGCELTFFNRLNYRVNALSLRSSLGYECVLRMGLEREANNETAVVVGSDKPPPMWFKRLADGALVVLADGTKGSIELVQVTDVHGPRKSIWLRKILGRWTIPGLTHLCVVDDHFIVAMDNEFRLSVIHFDRYCTTGEGIFACPVLEWSQKAKGRGRDDADRHARKKRRVEGPSLSK